MGVLLSDATEYLEHAMENLCNSHLWAILAVINVSVPNKKQVLHAKPFSVSEVFRRLTPWNRYNAGYEIEDPQRGQRLLSPKGKLVWTILPHQSQNFVNFNHPNTTAASPGTTINSKILSATITAKYTVARDAKTIIHHRKARRLKEAFLSVCRMKMCENNKSKKVMVSKYRIVNSQPSEKPASIRKEPSNGVFHFRFSTRKMISAEA